MTYRLVSALALCVSLVACSSDPEEEETCAAPSANVSFETEVLPLFRRSCGLSSSCHGSVTGSEAELYLGPKNADPAPDETARGAIIAGIVGKPSLTAPAMNLVTSGSPEQSFLMHKIDDTHNAQNLTCTAQPGAESKQPCGDRMPQGADIMSKCERDVIRAWIQQGAQNN